MKKLTHKDMNVKALIVPKSKEGFSSLINTNTSTLMLLYDLSLRERTLTVGFILGVGKRVGGTCSLASAV